MRRRALLKPAFSSSSCAACDRSSPAHPESAGDFLRIGRNLLAHHASGGLYQPMGAAEGLEIDTRQAGRSSRYDPPSHRSPTAAPSMGEQIPADPKEIARAFGMGW